MDSKTTVYGTKYEDIAKFILGNCSMGVAFEESEDVHINCLMSSLKNAPDDLIYYLSDATENNKIGES